MKFKEPDRITQAIETIRLAGAQFELTDSIESNLAHIEKLSRKAGARQVRLILFPECALSGYPGSDMDDFSALDVNEVRRALTQVGALAAELNLYIVVGVALPRESNWANALIVYDDSGRRICSYEKTALTHSDQRFFQRGGSDPVFTLDGLRLGCQICFDIRFAEGYRRLFTRDVQVVLHSYHQAGSKHFKQRRDIMKAFQRVRCSENGIYALTSNTIGRNRGKDQWIPTMAVNPVGDIISALKPSATDILIVDINGEDVVEMIELDIRSECARQMKIDLPGQRPVPGRDIR